MHWPISKALWRFAHRRVNGLAHRIAPLGPPLAPGKLGAPTRCAWLWSLNDWLANHYVQWAVTQLVEEGRLKL